MIATQAILVIAACLVAAAAIGVRLALSLRDIDASLERIARALENRGEAGRRGSGGAPGNSEGRPRDGAVECLPTEAEIAAAIAAASRSVPGHGGGKPGGEPSKRTGT
jgi:hypothetical protein